MSAAITAMLVVRNGADVLPATLRSLEAQTYRDFEVVAVDDGSTDGTFELLEAWSGLPLRVERLPAVGRAAARQRALELARGDIVCIQDADDRSRPERLAWTAEAFRDPKVDVAAGQALHWTPGGRSWRLMWYPTAEDEIRRGLATGRMTICHAASAFRRATVEAIGGYDVRCLRAQDLNLMIRLSRAGAKFLVTDRDLVDYGHPVLLSPRDWATRRAWADYAVSAARGETPPDPRHDLRSVYARMPRYPFAMARRLHAYLRSARRR